ncbi:hypothetical protein CTI12_AA455390 [Artemisia annua]|uniref:SNRNP25 ubiquitin-like domain-containing protein n=1 Tax=Artemisia annua TaxID=35608 RepID=A0A2U1LTQ1_ARTAN|nr:hypothetical protein CTI12_AA455390 [Artemisia annua]
MTEPSSSGVKDDNSVALEYNNNTLSLLDDPVLADVPRKPTLSDVDTLISLELGSAMRVSVLKLDQTSFDVAVMNSATVKDLKLAIKKKVNEMEQSKMGHRHISWKHVWRNFCLSYHNEKLLNDDAVLQDYGIRNHSQDFYCIGAFYSICHVKSFKEAFTKEKTSIFSWTQQKGMKCLFLANERKPDNFNCNERYVVNAFGRVVVEPRSLPPRSGNCSCPGKGLSVPSVSTLIGYLRR